MNLTGAILSQSLFQEEVRASFFWRPKRINIEVYRGLSILDMEFHENSSLETYNWLIYVDIEWMEVFISISEISIDLTQYDSSLLALECLFI